MAKISSKPIIIPAGVSAVVENGQVSVKGPKGQLTVDLLPKISLDLKDNQLVVKRADDSSQAKAFMGLIKALLRNAFIGVSEGYSKTLKLVGTGYRVAAMGKGISLSVGFSHPVEVSPPENITLAVVGQDTIKISGFDKQAVGQVAANIRKIRPPEPYKGKGIRYEDEIVRRKQGKTAAK
ncbi:MAG: 50S ribosomal protein L6 [bacterium]|nr:50S ribosomal protein L6 [bacterium]